MAQHFLGIDPETARQIPILLNTRNHNVSYRPPPPEHIVIDLPDENQPTVNVKLDTSSTAKIIGDQITSPDIPDIVITQEDLEIRITDVEPNKLADFLDKIKQMFGF